MAGRRRTHMRGMVERGVRAAVALGSLVVATIIGGALPAGATPGPNAVYVLTNQAAGNEVAVFDRAGDGTLTPAGSVPTGGLGSGAGLGSQGALILDGDRLFAVNAGSDEISVLEAGPGGLALLDSAPSGGDTPISLTVHGDLLYVLNSGGEGNISGFTVGSGGELAPLAGSTRPLSGVATGPAQVEFTPGGKLLVVTEKNTNKILTYALQPDGLTTGPTVQDSAGMTPFGFAFDRRSHLIVSEAFGGAVDQSAMSSYVVARDGTLTVISPSVGTTETAACWVVVSKNGRFAYTTNTGSGSISGYRIGNDGSLTLLDADGVTGSTGMGSSPLDMALSRNGRFLFVLEGGDHEVGAFRVLADGSLRPIAGGGGLPSGAVGVAAR
jgi:6-phosphogluconolactonase